MKTNSILLSNFVMYVWHCVCILIFLYSVYILIGESYEVIYVSSDHEDGIEPVDYLACFSLRTFYPNESQVRLEQMRSDLYEHFDKFDSVWKTKERKAYEELVLNRIWSMKYLIWADLVCIRLEGALDFMYIYLYFFKGMRTLAYNKRTFDRIELKANHYEINQLIVINRGLPYSKCLDGNYSRFLCLNECFKARSRLSKYLYDGNETGLLFLEPPDVKTLRGEQECFGHCDKETCRLVHYFPDLITRSNKSKPKIFKAIPLISAFEFWFQLVGTSCLIFGTSFHHSLFTLIEFVHSRIHSRIRANNPRFERTKNAALFIKSTVFLTGLLVFVFLIAKMALDFEQKTSRPIRREIMVNLVEPEPLNLVICIGFAHSVALHGNRTLFAIEKETDGELENTIDGIFLEFQNKQTKVDYVVQPMVAFKGWSRCFQLAIRPKEPKYQSLLAISKLTVKFRKAVFYFLILLTDGEQFSSDSFCHTGLYNFGKKVSKRTSRCLADYRQIHPNCSSPSR